MGVFTALGSFKDIYIYNNIFKANLNEEAWGTSVYLKNVENYKVFNNLTVDCHPEHRKIVGGSGTVDYNMAWNSDDSYLSLTPVKQDNDIVGINPNFTKYTGKHGENDYHLQANSPAINKGLTIESVNVDFDNNTRPQGSNYDIGAFEFK